MAKRINLKEILRKIDNKKTANEFIDMTSDVVLYLTKEKVKAKEVYERIGLAVRYSLLLDYYSETNKRFFYREAQKTKKDLYKKLGKKTQIDLEKIEQEIISFFENERNLMKKIRKGKNLSEKEVKKHIKMKASDAIYYSRILGDFIQKDLTKALHEGNMIFDIGKDISDYEEDYMKQPNILYSYLFISLKEKTPKGLNEALGLTRELGINKKILSLCNVFLQDIKRNRIPPLTNLAEKRYRKLKEILK